MLIRHDIKDTIPAFRVFSGSISYLIERAAVQQVERATRLQRHDDDCFVGSMEYGGEDVPVFDLGRLLGQESTLQDRGQILILQAQECLWGLLVDDLAAGCALSRSNIHPLPPLLREWCGQQVRAVVIEDNRATLLLDVNSLCPELGSASTPWEGVHQEDEIPCHGVDRERLLLFSTSAGIRPVHYGFRLGQVSEVVDVLPVTPVPSAPDWLRGVVGWRRSALVVVDLALRMGLPATNQDERTRLIVVQGAGTERVGFLARPDTRVVRLPIPHVLSERDWTSQEALLRGAVETQFGPLLIPDLEALMTRTRAVC